LGLVPSIGAEIFAHEFDTSQLSPDNPRTLIYYEQGVKIFAFPVVHSIFGPVGYRLEWEGLSMTFHGDGSPSSFEAEQAENVDVFMHEAFIDPQTFHIKIGIPRQTTELIAGKHTTGDRLGELMEMAKANLCVGYHYFLDDDTIDPFFTLLRKRSNRPFVLAQDLMVLMSHPSK
jgi:ribonuclease Z